MYHSTIAKVEESLKTCKRKFDKQLRHIKVILAQKRHQLTVKEWLTLVYETRSSILKSPEDFLCGTLPPPKLLSAAIERVFSDFVEDQRLLANQSMSTKWRIRHVHPYL